MEPAPAPASDEHELVQRLADLNQVGIALSQEKDLPRLLENILLAAQRITHA